MTPNIWWCNQTRQWPLELAKGVVCANGDIPYSPFRRMVFRARKGDIVIHYRSGIGVVAVSRALKNAVECREGDVSSLCIHGRGWAFPTDYHVFEHPVQAASLLEPLYELDIPKGPVIRGAKRLRVRQAYFMPLTREGLAIVREAAIENRWPAWATRWLPQPGTVSEPDRKRTSDAYAVGIAESSGDAVAIEGLLTEWKWLARSRSRRLRDQAFEQAAGVCAVCRRDFSQLLNGRGQHALQVHHLKQLAADDRPRNTKLRDLAVVCGTCHALIHSKPRRPFTVQHLRRMLRQEGYLQS